LEDAAQGKVYGLSAARAKEIQEKRKSTN